MRVPPLSAEGRSNLTFLKANKLEIASSPPVADPRNDLINIPMIEKFQLEEGYHGQGLNRQAT